MIHGLRGVSCAVSTIDRNLFGCRLRENIIASSKVRLFRTCVRWSGGALICFSDRTANTSWLSRWKNKSPHHHHRHPLPFRNETSMNLQLNFAKVGGSPSNLTRTARVLVRIADLALLATSIGTMMNVGTSATWLARDSIGNVCIPAYIDLGGLRK